MPVEIRHRPSPGPIEEQVFVALQRAADRLLQGVERLLKRRSLSPAQYNVLRILRGAGPEGLCCREIAERMVTRDPDMTRLLDRMERRGLVARERQDRDRRVVRVYATPAGLKLLRILDKPMREWHRRSLRHVSAATLRVVARFLEDACQSESKGSSEA
ncbi:MAG TPA: MarR family transcriptional regulator [Methylomirabilota bacterium]|nr:MarR family transcriptional regulator [Methylomirabilota bacterium]